MDFDITDAQKRVRERAREFAWKELLPHCTRWDREGEFPRDLVRKMGETGLMVSTIPREYGGLGTDRVTNGLIVEELARGDGNLSLLAFGTLYDLLALAPIELRREWCPKVAQGERFLGIALTEPQSGSDAANVRARAECRGDVYIANGVKNCVSILNADGWALLARTDEGAGARGISMFLLHKDTPGLTVSEPKSDLGGRAVPRGILTLEDARIPAGALMGEEHRGFYHIMDIFDYNRALIGLMCVGAARQSLEETIEYAKGRRSFGRVISLNQGVSFPIAEAETYLELARNLCLKVLWLKDNDRPLRKESAMCKWWVPKMCVEIIHQCLLIHGHYGYSRDLPIEQRLRDVLGWEIGDGTAQIQKLIIARELMGREFVG